MKGFAKELGVSFAAYQNYEYGKRVPPGHVLSKIAALCLVTTDYLLTGESILSRIAEEPAQYGDVVTEEINAILRDMDEVARRDVLKYARFIYEEKHKKEVG